MRGSESIHNIGMSPKERLRIADPLYRLAVARCLLAAYKHEPNWDGQRPNIDHAVFKAAFRSQEKEWNNSLKASLAENRYWTTHRRRRKGSNCQESGSAIRAQILLRRPIKLDPNSDQTNRILDLSTEKPSITMIVHAWPNAGQPNLKSGASFAQVRLVGSPSFFQEMNLSYGDGFMRFQEAHKGKEMEAITLAISKGRTDKIPQLFRVLLDAWFNPNSKREPKQYW
jgi:hypothetical protein